MFLLITTIIILFFSDQDGLIPNKHVDTHVKFAGNDNENTTVIMTTEETALLGNDGSTVEYNHLSQAETSFSSPIAYTPPPAKQPGPPIIRLKRQSR